MKYTNTNFIKLTFPPVLLQLIEFGSMFIDSAMIGNYDPISFGATSLSGMIFYFIFTLFFGIMMMIGPLIGQARGANNNELIAKNVSSGIWIGMIFAIILFIIFSYIVEIVAIFNFSDDIITVMRDFIAGKKYSVLIFVAMPFRYFLVNQGIFRQIIFLSIMVFPLNILFNYVFIYGYGFIPEMGVYGAGIATSVSVITSSVLLWIFASNYAQKQGIKIYHKFFEIDFQILKRILKYGIPTGIALGLETLLFTTSNIYVAYFDKYSISAFAVTFQIWNICYAIVLGFSEGVAILVAKSAGEKNINDIIQTIKQAVIKMAIILLLLCLWYYYTSNYIFEFMLDTNNSAYPMIIKIADDLKYLIIVAIMVECTVHLPTKLLQSINDTKYIPIAQFIGYILIGVSSGYILCFIYDFKNEGIYISMILGIITTSLILITRIIYSLNKKRIFKYVETK